MLYLRGDEESIALSLDVISGVLNFMNEVCFVNVEVVRFSERAKGVETPRKLVCLEGVSGGVQCEEESEQLACSFCSSSFSDCAIILILNLIPRCFHNNLKTTPLHSTPPSAS